MRVTHTIKPLTIATICFALVSAGCTTRSASNSMGVSANQAGDTNRERVVGRLIEVGYNKEEAIARVNQMTEDEIAYFASHPESVQRSGFIIIASLIGSSVYSSVKQGEKKRNNYIAKLNSTIAGFRTEILSLENDNRLETTLLAVEQDPAKRPERVAAIKRLGNEIQSKRDHIKSLENEIEAIKTKKQKVPKDFKN